MNFRNLEEFWAFYVNQQSKPSMRRWHFVGTLIGIFFLLCSMVFSRWLLFSIPFFGYGFLNNGLVWYSHFFIEGNIPTTFGHPIWSLVYDLKMFGLMLTGKMDKEIKRLGKSYGHFYYMLLLEDFLGAFCVGGFVIDLIVVEGFVGNGDRAPIYVRLSSHVSTCKTDSLVPKDHPQ
ncbi:uncharacterized protein LOC118348755 [Juglans regia]|uniref:Uncharacterized protein LOC118348755 n=1 Tax=Juglans regia TaxID=51240 RepID=A0A6P9EFC6_JUGRE|nr:uncharacterized protein LOC118348755 [Juglans regia]